MLQPGSFSLPKEFEGFVSNADSLMEQFKRLDIEDEVTVSIYPDVQLSQQGLLDLLERLTVFIDQISESFIWFKEALKLALIVPDNPKQLAHFCGKVKFADSIEDEWFIVYIALKLSESFPNTSTTVTDTDGQFLLIEAADFIPDWIDPENSEGRLWLRRGKVHIVPLDEAGRNIHDNGIKTEAALDAIQKRPNDTLAAKEVQTAIYQRTTSVYPHKAAADAHITHCTVSSTVAKLLTKSPELISAAVNSFCMPASSGSNKNYIAAMQKFGGDLTDLETVPMRFTRLQYAKLAYQNFHIPKKFHGASRIIGGTENRKLTQSFDMGCRLMCGFEAMYQREKSETASNARSRVKNQNEINLKNNIESKVYYSSKHKKEYNLSTAIDSILGNKITDSTDTTKGKKNIYDGNESSVEMKKSRDLLEAFKRICKETPEDSDAWMYLSPEELDLEMESRIKKIQKENIISTSATDKASSITIPSKTNIKKEYLNNSANDKKKNEEKNGEENPSSDQLMKMLEGMKAFLGTKSGPEGIEDAIKSVTKSKTVKSIIAKNTEIFADSNAKILSENGNVVRVKESEVNAPNNNNTTENKCINTDNNDDDGEPLEFDFDKLQDILQNFGENETSNIHENENENENESSKMKNEPLNLSSDPSKNPLGDYFYEKDLEEFSSDDDSDYDSDDEVDHGVVSSRVEEIQFNEHKKSREENSEKQDEVEITSKVTNHNHLEDDFQLSIIGMKNIKIDIKTTSESNSHSSFNSKFNAKLDFSSRGNGVHDVIGREKSNDNNNDDNNNNDEIEDDDDDDTDSFYDDSDTDSDDEIDSRPISDKKYRPAGVINTDNSGGKMNMMNDRAQGSDGGVEVEGLGEGEEGFEGRYFQEYENSMDLELTNSTLVESFERYTKDAGTVDQHSDIDQEPRRSGKEDSAEPEAVDVDLNFLKYLLESHASQLGSAGPATQLFSQLGVHLPHLPPMNSKPDSDVQ